MGYDKMKRVLITGSNGFLGTNLVKRLLTDPDVIIRAMVQPKTPVDILEKFQKESGTNRLEIVFADMMLKDTLPPVMKDVDQIVHLASLVTDWASRDAYFRICVEGTKNILEKAGVAGVKRFIFMSSLTVHEFGNAINQDETAPRNMKSFAYGEAKIQAEDLVSQWAQNNGRDYALVRPGFTLFGPYDRASFIQVIDAIKKGGMGMINSGKALTSYVYSENLVYGIHLLLSAPKISGPYNILDGNMSWKEFNSKWAEKLNVKSPSLNIPYWIIYPIVAIMEDTYLLFRRKKSPPLIRYRIRIAAKNLSFSNSKIVKELGYNPPVSFEESISRTVEWYDYLHEIHEK